MPTIEFKNAELNKGYLIKAPADQEVRTPDGYKGFLSDINKTSILDGMIERKSNLVAKKEVPPPPPAQDPKK